MSLLPVGLSHAFLNKQHIQPHIRQNQFSTTDVTLTELIQHILKGKAWTPGFFKDGLRRKSHFQGAQFLVLDLDDNVSVAQARQQPFINQYACLIHASPSSQPGHHKTRVIIALDEIVPHAKVYETLQLSVLEEMAVLKPDAACKDEIEQVLHSTPMAARSIQYLFRRHGVRDQDGVPVNAIALKLRTTYAPQLYQLAIDIQMIKHEKVNLHPYRAPPMEKRFVANDMDWLDEAFVDHRPGSVELGCTKRPEVKGEH